MKKLVILLTVIMFLVTGCSTVQRINTDDLKSTIESTIYNKNNLYTISNEGYKYYVPRGMKFVNKEEYNAIFKDRYNGYYYLYVDVISYYHKTQNIYKTDKFAYLSLKLEKDKKQGYFEISKVKDKYFIEAMYNYVKIEAFVDKQYLNMAVINISSILSSVKYNDMILETLVGDKKLSYKEEKFSISKSNKKATDFLNYVKEYDKDSEKDNKSSDDDNVEIIEED